LLAKRALFFIGQQCYKAKFIKILIYSLRVFFPLHCLYY